MLATEIVHRNELMRQGKADVVHLLSLPSFHTTAQLVIPRPAVQGVSALVTTALEPT